MRNIMCIDIKVTFKFILSILESISLKISFNGGEIFCL